MMTGEPLGTTVDGAADGPLHLLSPGENPYATVLPSMPAPIPNNIGDGMPCLPPCSLFSGTWDKWSVDGVQSGWPELTEAIQLLAQTLANLEARLAQELDVALSAISHCDSCIQGHGERVCDDVESKIAKRLAKVEAQLNGLMGEVQGRLGSIGIFANVAYVPQALDTRLPDGQLPPALPAPHNVDLIGSTGSNAGVDAAPVALPVPLPSDVSVSFTMPYAADIGAILATIAALTLRELLISAGLVIPNDNPDAGEELADDSDLVLTSDLDPFGSLRFAKFVADDSQPDLQSTGQ